MKEIPKILFCVLSLFCLCACRTFDLSHFNYFPFLLSYVLFFFSVSYNKSINIGEFSSTSLSYVKKLFSFFFVALAQRKEETRPFFTSLYPQKNIRNKKYLKLVCLRVATIKMFTPSFVCVYIWHISYVNFFTSNLNCEKEAYFVSFISQ